MFYDCIIKYTDIFVERNVRSFCSAKASEISSTKNIGIFQIFTFENLMKRLLMTSLVLSSRLLIAFPEGRIRKSHKLFSFVSHFLRASSFSFRLQWTKKPLENGAYSQKKPFSHNKKSKFFSLETDFYWEGRQTNTMAELLPLKVLPVTVRRRRTVLVLGEGTMFKLL